MPTTEATSVGGEDVLREIGPAGSRVEGADVFSKLQTGVAGCSRGVRASSVDHHGFMDPHGIDLRAGLFKVPH